MNIGRVDISQVFRLLPIFLNYNFAAMWNHNLTIQGHLWEGRLQCMSTVALLYIDGFTLKWEDFWLISTLLVVRDASGDVFIHS